MIGCLALFPSNQASSLNNIDHFAYGLRVKSEIVVSALLKVQDLITSIRLRITQSWERRS